MDRRLKSYLRPLRRRWGLTQRELAFLIGLKSGTLVSRIESLKRTPKLEAVFACAVIFGTAPIELFSGIYTEIEQAVHGRAAELYEQLQGDPSKLTRIKLDFLETLLARLQSESSERV